jgi:hypothetical protein
MNDTAVVDPSTMEFQMYGARLAVAGGWLHMEEQVRGIERAVVENPSFAFDLAKTIVESACKTILDERKTAYALDDKLPRLFKAVTSSLPLLPPGASGETEARKSLAQTLGGLHTVLQGICELRNAHGFASHGSGGQRPAMESVQALLAAQAADTIVGFLYRVHRPQSSRSGSGPSQFEENSAFNTFVDEANDPVRIFELEYRPSEVLFSVDGDAYREILAGYTPETPENSIDGAEPAVVAS